MITKKHCPKCTRPLLMLASYKPNETWFYCGDCMISYSEGFLDECFTKPTNTPLKPTCNHITGSTPLQNPSKGNIWFLICKLCGEDMDYFNDR